MLLLWDTLKNHKQEMPAYGSNSPLIYPTNLIKKAQTDDEFDPICETAEFQSLINAYITEEKDEKLNTPHPLW